MPLSRLVIQQFRNIKACDIRLSAGFNSYRAEWPR